MAKFYNADTLLEFVKQNTPNINGETTMQCVERAIKEAPTADVKEVKRGHWIYKHRHRGGFDRMITHDDYGNPHTVTIDNRYECDEPYCSECGKLGGDFLNFCGNCGADMRGEENDL